MSTPRSFTDQPPGPRHTGAGLANPPAAAPPRRWSLLRPFNPPLTDWTGLRVWVVGASSGIGEATARALMASGAQVQVSARNADALNKLVSTPGAPAHTRAWPLDVTDAEAVAHTAREMLKAGPIDLVLYCAGHYREMRATDMDLADLRQHLAVNYTGALNVIHAVLPAMTARGSGHLSLISSVAGFRGLPKSLAYGPTKAALTNLAENLYLDLEPLGLGVSVIHPGFVQTPLTAQNDFTMPALISPDAAAQAMLQGWAQGDFNIHYPKRFTRAMLALRLLPYRLYFPAIRRFTGL